MTYNFKRELYYGLNSIDTRSTKTIDIQNKTYPANIVKSFLKSFKSIHDFDVQPTEDFILITWPGGSARIKPKEEK